jgi:ribosomal protein S18 acetylase RimI-like enzyme
VTAVSRERHAAAAEYTVELLHDRSAIRGMLEPERAYSAYALAQLDPRFFENNDWVLARGPAGRQALVVHSRTGLGNALFATGDAVALDAVLSLHPGARFSFGSLRLEHRPIVEKYYLMTRPQMMMRMSVHRHTFAAQDGPAVRLSGADVSLINRLYSMEGGPTAYREAHMLDGVYYGVFEGSRLVSIAGTHVVSEREGIAVVGNVFTHPRCRGRGLARYATSAVTRHLLEVCDLVVLTVEVGNEPAVGIYEKLGYQPVCNLHESPLIRKEPFGAISFVRRTIAGWRGRQTGKEIVVK